MGIDAVTALSIFNLAPLSLRRDNAMLGLIRRTILGEGPPHFQRWFYREDVVNRRSGRHGGHGLRVHAYRNGTHLDIVKRSALRLCSIYNLLPEEIVKARSVKCFQRLLQGLAKDCARRGVPEWQHLLSNRQVLHIHILRRTYYGLLYILCMYIINSGHDCMCAFLRGCCY